MKMKMKAMWCAVVAGMCCLLTPCVSCGAEFGPGVTVGDVTLGFDAVTRTFMVSHAQTGMIRSLVGPDKFINACWGTPVEAMGLVNGSRTGGDSGLAPHAIEVVLRWNFLSNIAWWCDPDAAANLFKAPLERVRLNAQARVLTGQQFLTDDLWTKVEPASCRVWQQSFPSLDIRPANLYPVTDLRRYDLFDLRIAKPWGTWDVVGLFNCDGHAVEKTLDLARLPLDAAAVYVFDYWHNKYLGRFPRDAKLPAKMAAFEGCLFCVVPAPDERPVLVSTSRHLSQGGLDLDMLEWKQDGSNWTVTGKSTHLIKGDPYELVFVAGRFAARSGTSPGGKISLSRGEGVARAKILPNESGGAEWRIVFAPVTEGLLDTTPLSLDLAPGASGELTLRNLGPKPVRFTLKSSEPRVKITPNQGEIGPWPATTRVTLAADLADVEPGKSLTAMVAVETPGTPPNSVQVIARAPLPVNLARDAKATASSIWGPEYDAAKAIDGDPDTRWSSRDGDKEGAWIELAWDQPVLLDRVVLDEYLNEGSRVQAWNLLAGKGELEEIAKGEGMGNRKTVELPTPVEARRLRLLIEKASVVPTLKEIEVGLRKKPKERK
ncbi:MAG: discoidin domain-containing protein [Verrucomicrobia bacterium]|nr:discoidin domain-containing protein [Verrucomicrobiota bacterium]